MYAGSPVIVGFTNVSEMGFREGDHLNLTVVFMVNPIAEVSWTFTSWNTNRSRDVQSYTVQNQKEFNTTIVITSLDKSDFGIFSLQLRNKIGSTRMGFKIQGNFRLFRIHSIKSNSL